MPTSSGTLSSLIAQLMSTWLNAPTASHESTDYESWQRQFLSDRLRLANKLAIYHTLSLIALVIVAHSLITNNGFWLIQNIAVLISLAIAAGLQKTALGRNHPDAIFVSIGWSMTWFNEIARALMGYVVPDLLVWTIAFLLLAAVVPIRWQLHLLTQLGVVAFYSLARLVITPGPHSLSIDQIEIWILIGWVCLICDLAVYLYERLRRAEFKTQQGLQSFIQTVSFDLRSPTVHNLDLLKRLLAQSGNQLTIARSTLEAMQQSSDRQIALIELLLARARTAINQAASLSPQLLNQPWLTQWWGAKLTLLQRLYNHATSRFSGKSTSLNLEANSPPVSADYARWRYHFMMARLQLVAWVSLGVVVTMSFPAIYRAIVDPTTRPKLLTFGLLLGVLMLWLSAYRRFSKNAQPALLFLGLAASLTIVSQFSEAFVSSPKPLIFAWTFVFMMMATLIPVCWNLHLIAQLTTIASYLVVISIWGINLEPEPGRLLIRFFYLGWISFICDFAVYTYEQLQRSEFESQRQLQIFLHSVAHDLRTPIIGTAMVLDNLLNKAEETITLPRSVIERIITGNDRQLGLIDSLLEAHASTHTGTVCHCEPTQLKPLIQSVIHDLEPMLQQNRAILIDHIAADLPLVSADSTQLWRVFENLITNAMKFNLPGVQIDLTAVVEENQIRCSVQDNGAGISPELGARLFDLYSRGTQVRRSPGLGLGLYLCRQIITAHGGKIGVISNPGSGATFWFTLPLNSSL
jgi:signal transduction histidine kinase